MECKGVKYRVWSRKLGVWSAERGVSSVERKAWSANFGA